MTVPFAHSFWGEFQNTIDPEQFRGEGHYLAQRKGASEKQYVAAYEYAKKVAPDLLEKFSEDGAFGAITFDIDGRKVSRDLIDSVLELNFIRSHVPLNCQIMFDIGAGYGRFASRLIELFPDNAIYCLDAVPVSTEICRRYLMYRHTTHARAVPLEELKPIGTADLAVNIHSWSECTLDAIQFWIDFIVARDVGWLFVVPHDDRFLAMESDGSRPSFLPLILKHYDLVEQRPKYPRGIDGAFPTVYAMFRRKNA